MIFQGNNDREHFTGFTERAKKVLMLAVEEAQRHQRQSVGTEYLLLGLIREEQGVGARILQNLGVDPQQLQDMIEAQPQQPEEEPAGQIELNLEAKKAIELAVDEARRLNHHYIGTEHLLLGLARQPESAAGKLLSSLGVDLEQIKTQTIQIISMHRKISSAPPTGEVGEQARGAAETERERNRFHKFTERARHVLAFAQEEAQRFQHNYIGTEHLLLGLLREEQGMAAKILKSMGIELQKVRSSVEFIIGRGDRIVLGEIGLTPRAKKVIELAVDESTRLNHSYIGTEHLLLAMVREGSGIAAGVLESLGARLENVRKATIKVLQEQGTPVEAPTAEQSDNDDNFTTLKRQLLISAYNLLNRQKMTMQAGKVIEVARQESEQRQHSYIGTQHVLVGLLMVEGIPSQVLQEAGVELDALQKILAAQEGSEHMLTQSINSGGFSPLVSAQIYLAAYEALRLGKNVIEPEHLLLGLLDLDEGEGIQALTALGVQQATLRQQLLQRLQ